jgi:hypothetical protein
MTDTQFKLLQFLAGPLAVFFFAQWWALPEKLQRSSSDTATVSAAYSTYKGGQAVLTETTGEVLVVRCGQASSLCQALETRSIPNLQIWVLRPTLLREARLVAAEEGKSALVSEAQQNALLQRAKLLKACLALFFTALAGLLWYFSPFNTARKRTNAA